MSRKRDKPYTSTHIPYSFQKRRRPLPNPTTTATSDQNPPGKPSPPPAVAIIGLPTDCSVLDLKSRFEIYGSISRIRIDHEGVGFITFRTRSAAESAVSAALDPSFGITLDSKRVQVLWTSGSKNREASEREQSLSSKLLRAERPLSTHRRDNWIPATVTSNSGSDGGGGGGGGGGGTGTPLRDHQSFKGRQIVAYDDIL